MTESPINGIFIFGWRLKETDFVVTDKKQLHNVTDDDFEPTIIGISSEDLERIRGSLNEESEADD